ncbi:hypothetical protein MCOR31_003334 [Pyricularia oryzae]|nr:hypothetical protein MCOR31_003334 [Pyricularia oryzae]KAI6529709.1 hypothetical protein MCOR10_003605 [Pyricularia oryzae]
MKKGLGNRILASGFKKLNGKLPVAGCVSIWLSVNGGNSKTGYPSSLKYTHSRNASNLQENFHHFLGGTSVQGNS